MHQIKISGLGARRPAVRRALTAGLAGAALCHGGATAEAQVAAQDSAELPAASPTPDASPTPTPTPVPTAQAEPEPIAQASPAAVAQPDLAPAVDAPVSGEMPTGGGAAPAGQAPDPQPIPAAKPEPTAAPAPAGRGDRAHGQAKRRHAYTRRPARRRAIQHPHATPTPAPASAGHTVLMPAAMPLGVPDFFIDRFRIPPFLLPIYQAAGTEYGVQWEVLAAINEIETDYGRNLAVSTAGALGWMQFMPSTWRRYGVDANRDGVKDPYNPFDAIFAAARYLRAAGADRDIRRALFAYNHADWYVESVLLRARTIGGMPSDLIGSLSGLVAGRFPVRARATYASRHSGPAARPQTIRITARAGAPVVAVHDARVVATGHSGRFGRYVTLRDAYGNRFTYGHLSALPGAVRRGVRVAGGAVIGRVAAGRGVASHLSFRVRPPGRDAPWIDPTPLLEGWKLLESTAIYHAAGRSRLFGEGAGAPTIGQILLMGKGALARRVLADPRLDIYGCGRRDIEAGVIDRRVLATLAFLSASGLRPTVSSLRCGHGVLTSSGNVSEHAGGGAVDIAAVNGIAISGNQGAGSITELTIRRLLTLQGVMEPHQIISTMTFAGADNTLAMSDHADHIHVGWRSRYGTIGRVDARLRPKQWIKLIDRLGRIDNPVVARDREAR
jgi:Transglycosylase SLT domain/Peptidase family M23